MTPHYQDDSVTLWNGDALEVLTQLPSGSVDCIVTSPPYYGLRDYGTEGQYGLESSPAEYVETMRALFNESRRVLSDDGTLWLNIGDSYQSSGGTTGVGPNASVGSTRRQSESRTRPVSDLPPKNLMGIPWSVAFALQDDGWILRNDIIWAKPNGMPESVNDRLTTKHEHIFLFSKQARYWFDLDPIREQSTTVRPDALRWDRDSKEADIPGQSMRQHRAGRTDATPPGANPQTFGPAGQRNGKFHDAGKNPGDVWTVATQPFSEAHFAVMPQQLASRAIQAGCKPGGTVLDPFSGSGTTGLAAAKNGRKYVGIDLNAEYLDLSLRTRLSQVALFSDYGDD